MENTDTNRVNMIRTTASYCDNNPAPTAGIPAFATLLTAVQAKLVLIDQLDQIAIGTTTGVTLDTNNLRATMSALALKCASAVTAYANAVNNNTLKQKVNYPASDFPRFKKEEVDDICQTIHDEANTNIAAAGAYGYAAADVTNLQTAIDLYRTSIQNPRQAIITKSSAINQIKDIIRDIIDNSFKGQMDKMVTTLKISAATFYNEYFQAREIIDIGATTAKVRGTVTDNEGNPLAGVKFIIFQTGTATVVNSNTTLADGKFNIANILPGDYDFSWDLAGYQPQRENGVRITAGRELRRTITMLPA